MEDRHDDIESSIDLRHANQRSKIAAPATALALTALLAASLAPWSLAPTLTGPNALVTEPATCGGAPPRATAVEISAFKFRRLVKRAEVPVLVEFGADWCLSCRHMVPVLDAVAADFSGRAVVARVNVATQPGLTAELEVVQLPTLLLFQDGRLVRRAIGSRSRDELGRLLERSLTEKTTGPGGG